MDFRSSTLILCIATLSGCDLFTDPKPLAPQAGRYVVTYSRMNARDTFLVDTATGDTWQLVEDEEKNASWQRMDRDGADPWMELSGNGSAEK